MAIQQLGPYRIGRQLGRGGMGAVYEAVDPDSDTRVAVKVLSPSLAAHEDFRERFEVEIETLRKLRHPNIVRIYAFGEQQGILFYAMELVEGRSLEELIRAGRRFHWREVTNLACCLCRALKHAHDRGVIHRDIKPANLLLTEAGEIKLTDFGIAKLFGMTGLTAAGGVVGTAEYMAPEQCDGRRVTPRSDLYSLGGVLYTLLAGRPPFVAETIPQMLQLQRFADPEPLSAYAPDVPEALQQIIADLLAKDPADRVPSAMMLLKRLEAMLHGLSRLKEITPSSQTQTDPDARQTCVRPSDAPANPPADVSDAAGSPTLDAGSQGLQPEPASGRKENRGIAGATAAGNENEADAAAADELPPGGLDLTVAASASHAANPAQPLDERPTATQRPAEAAPDLPAEDGGEPLTLETTRAVDAEAIASVAHRSPASRVADEQRSADPAEQFDVAETAAASRVDAPPVHTPEASPDDMPTIPARRPEAPPDGPASEPRGPVQQSQHAAQRVATPEGQGLDAHTASSAAGTLMQQPADASAEGDTTPPAAPRDRFTTVEDEEPDLLEEPSRAWAALWSPQVWLLAGSLLGVAALGWYATRPPSADAWYERLTRQSTDATPESLLETAEEARQFLATFPDDPRRDQVESLLEETELIRLERRLERRASRLAKSTRSASLSPVERAYLEAIAHARMEPESGAVRLQALIDLFGPLAAESGDRLQQRCVELARRRLKRLESRIVRQAQSERQLLSEQLARAAALAPDQPDQARRIWQAIVRLYGAKPWAEPFVDEAHAQLRRMAAKAAPASSPTDSESDNTDDAKASEPSESQQLPNESSRD